MGTTLSSRGAGQLSTCRSFSSQADGSTAGAKRHSGPVVVTEQPWVRSYRPWSVVSRGMGMRSFSWVKVPGVLGLPTVERLACMCPVPEVAKALVSVPETERYSLS